MTEVVGEFPEVQGLMGRKYALLQGEHESVAAAIEDHYKPQGPSDRVPTDRVAVAVALADKLDVLTGFWRIDEKPTGSKDPFALRRAALGVIRLLADNGLKFSLGRIDGFSADLLSFFHDRLKVLLRDQGQRHDLVDAVLASARAMTTCCSSSAASRRSPPCSAPRTGKTSSPAPSAPSTSCASRRRRTAAPMTARRMPPSSRHRACLRRRRCSPSSSPPRPGPATMSAARTMPAR